MGGLSTEQLLDITANREGNIVAINASGSGSKGKEGISVAGNVSLSTIRNNTQAYIKDTTVEGNTTGTDTNINIKAKDASDIRTISAAVGYGGKAGIGGTVATANVSNITNAFTDNSTITANNLSTIAINENFILTVGVAGGVSKDAAGIGVAASVNSITNVTQAGLWDSDGGANKLVTLNGALTVHAFDQASGDSGVDIAADNPGLPADLFDNSGTTTVDSDEGKSVTVKELGTGSDLKIVAITLGAGVGKKAGVGASIAVNEIANRNLVKIENVQITTKGTKAGNGVDLKAFSGGQIINIGVGGGSSGGAGKVSGGVNISVNRIGSTTDIVLGDTDIIVHHGDFQAFANDASDILSISAAGAVGGDVALAGSGSFNQIRSSTEIIFDSTDVEVKIGAIDALASTTGSIQAIAIAGSRRFKRRRGGNSSN